MKTNWKLASLIFQHCSAHRLQLVAKAVARESRAISDGLSTAQALYIFFNNSNKKLELLKGWAHGLTEGKAIKLVEVAPTRWLSHGNAVKRLPKLYTAIAKTLEFIQDNINYDADHRTRAMGLLHAMLSKRTIITFVYLDLVLSKLNSLSELFQNKKVTLNTAILATEGTVSEFTELKTIMNNHGFCYLVVLGLDIHIVNYQA